MNTQRMSLVLAILIVVSLVLSACVVVGETLTPAPTIKVVVTVQGQPTKTIRSTPIPSARVAQAPAGKGTPTPSPAPTNAPLPTGNLNCVTRSMNGTGTVTCQVKRIDQFLPGQPAWDVTLTDAKGLTTVFVALEPGWYYEDVDEEPFEVVLSDPNIATATPTPVVSSSGTFGNCPVRKPLDTLDARRDSNCANDKKFNQSQINNMGILCYGFHPEMCSCYDRKIDCPLAKTFPCVKIARALMDGINELPEDVELVEMEDTGAVGGMYSGNLVHGPFQDHIWYHTLTGSFTLEVHKTSDGYSVDFGGIKKTVRGKYLYFKYGSILLYIEKIGDIWYNAQYESCLD